MKVQDLGFCEKQAFDMFTGFLVIPALFFSNWKFWGFMRTGWFKGSFIGHFYRNLVTDWEVFGSMWNFTGHQAQKRGCLVSVQVFLLSFTAHLNFPLVNSNCLCQGSSISLWRPSSWFCFLFQIQSCKHLLNLFFFQWALFFHHS